MDTATIKPAALALLVIPAIGSLCEDQGGIYLGIGRGTDGEPDGHCFMAVDMPDADMNQAGLIEWGENLRVGEHADFKIWTRDESALAYANARDQVDARYWYFTRTRFSPGRACCQYFLDGLQFIHNVQFKARARAVRRLPISPSVL